MKPRLWCWVLGLAMLPAAFALDVQAERAERDRIAAERAGVEATFGERERACRERFVVTSCLEDARRDRRQALENLRQQQVILDEAQRKQRAAQRMDDIRAKVSGEEAQRRKAPVHERGRPPKRPDDGASREPHRPAASPASAALPASAARAAASARIGEYEKRKTEAREHREAVQRRNAEKAAQGKVPAAPLPVPGAASSPP
ncbi:hypothetical protein [Piscinibacter sp. XHJ-5]|uniref:hypothetical protein n=1 Tax=Piscinibacter sp. XHJ-5 TaxID=3037797 RepID=UPI0024536ECB|nr:hypothetical protein [Piscinibacter sp. XHJ-5]